MKKVSLSLLLIFLLTQSFSQNFVSYIDKQYLSPYDFYYFNSHIMEMSDGNILVPTSYFSVKDGYVETGSKSIKFIKLSPDAEIIDSLLFECKYPNTFDDKSAKLIRNPYEVNSNVYWYCSYSEQFDTCYYNAVFFNNDLEITDEVRVIFPGNYFPNGQNSLGISNMMCRDNDFIHLTYFDGKCIVTKMDIYGNIKIRKENVLENTIKEAGIYYFSWFVYNEDPLQYGFAIQAIDDRLVYIVLDEDLNIVKEVPIPKMYNENYFIKGGDFKSVINTEDGNFATLDVLHTKTSLTKDKLVVHSMDKEFNLMDKYTIKTWELIGPYANPNDVNLIKCEDGSMYCIWVFGEKYNYNLYVTRLDKYYNLQWECCFYKGYRYVNGLNVTTLDNGGLAVSLNHIYGSLPGNSATSVYIFKHDETALSEQLPQVRPYSFYPNPAGEMINVSFAQDVNCENVEIYSLDGRLCHSQNFNFNNINIDNLSSGIYMMKITLNNGQTFTEKVVVR